MASQNSGRLPERIGVASERLGALISGHGPSSTQHSRSDRGAKFARAVGRGLLLLGVAGGAYHQSWMVFLLVAGMGAFLEMGALLVVRGTWEASFQGIELYALGLRHEQRSGALELRWKDFAELAIDAHVHRGGWGEWRLLGTLDNGEPFDTTIAVGHLERPDLLRTLLLDLSGRAIQARVLEQWSQRGHVDFGPLEVTTEGIRVRDELRLWRHVGTFSMRNGVLRGVHQGATWCRIRAGQVRNLAGLLAILGERMDPTATAKDWVRVWGR